MYLQWVSSLIAVCIMAFPMLADEQSESAAKARAAIAIAQVQRAREVAKTAQVKPEAGVAESDNHGCFDDIDVARRVAKKLKKPLVIWVGMTCAEAPKVHKAIQEDTVGVHLRAYNNSVTPRIVVTDPTNNVEYRVLKKEIDATTPISIRRRMGLEIGDRLYNEWLQEVHQIQLNSPTVAVTQSAQPVYAYPPSFYSFNGGGNTGFGVASFSGYSTAITNCVSG